MYNIKSKLYFCINLLSIILEYVSAFLTIYLQPMYKTQRKIITYSTTKCFTSCSLDLSFAVLYVLQQPKPNENKEINIYWNILKSIFFICLLLFGYGFTPILSASCLSIYPVEGSGRMLRNFGKFLPHWMTSHPRRQRSPLSLPCDLQSRLISYCVRVQRDSWMMIISVLSYAFTGFKLYFRNHTTDAGREGEFHPTSSPFMKKKKYSFSLRAF